MTGSMLALTPFQFRLRRNQQLSDVKPALELEGLLARLVLRERRADIPYPAIDPDADAWSKGIALQLKIEPVAEGTPH